MAMIWNLLKLLIPIGGSVLARLMADEFKAWTPSMVSRLIAIAVQLLPDGERQRWTEEWHSHATDIPGEISKFVFALSLLVAASRMSISLRARTKNLHFEELLHRGFDFSLSAAAVLTCGPLLAAITLMVKLTSRGPLLWWKERIGLNGHVIRVPKFRTCGTSEFRRTRIGTILSRTSLDDLPMFLSFFAAIWLLSVRAPSTPRRLK